MSFRRMIPDNAPPRVRGTVLAQWFGVSYSTVMRWARTGHLPKPLPLGPRTHLFDVAEVRLYVDCLIENLHPEGS